ncbi:MAG: TIGR03643 family protein [Bacteriovoracaceae bacterium]
MGISRELKESWSHFNQEDLDRIVRMAWEDRTTFDVINKQFGLTPNQVVRFMRTQLDDKAYKRWRRRATQQGHLKHGKRRPEGITRFKCSRQRLDGSIKG